MAEEIIRPVHNKNNPRKDLTAEYIRSVLDYDPESGKLIWKYREAWGPSRRRRLCGKEAGYYCKGYIRIKINGVFYAGHRLAWLHYYGRWPLAEIDHRNLDRADNRIDNLRESTCTQNNRNRGLSKKNTSGYKGVSFIRSRPGRKKFVAAIRVDKKAITLGWYENPEDAYEAYCQAVAKYHGEFARR